MRIGQQIGLPPSDLGDLYYSLLLKDAGCSSNSSRLFHTINADEIRAKGDVKTTDWTRTGWESLHYAVTHVAVGRPFVERVRTLVRVAAKQQQESWELVKIRCERGASVARKMGFPESVAAAIHSLDEHWNGRGYPDGLCGEEIPLLARIMLLAQTLDVFFMHRGPEAAVEVAGRRSGRWFDPNLVSAAASLAKSGQLWEGLDSDDVVTKAVLMEPEQRSLEATEFRLDSICLAFAEVIDAKSPFTYRHSNGVAEAAVAIGRRLGLNERNVTFLRRTALLHDIGKLGVPNVILEKPDKPNGAEWKVIRRHPYYTLEILRRITGFEEFSEVAASHHEKLDGSGYFRQLRGEQLSLPARILVVADMFDALTAARPYREALPLETVLATLRRDTPHAVDVKCVEALIEAALESESSSTEVPVSGAGYVN
jgi:putative nucleotidyltransferase with HDIG domain